MPQWPMLPQLQTSFNASELLYRQPDTSLQSSSRSEIIVCTRCQIEIEAVFGYKNQNSKKKFRHLHGDLNLDVIKNALRLLSVNGETNLMNLIRD